MSDQEKTISDDHSIAKRSWQPVRELAAIGFWRGSFSYLNAFLPTCLSPAFLVTASLIVMVFGNVGFYSQLSRGALTVNDLLHSALTCLGCTAIGLILFVAGFGKWLFVSTAFCRYWYSLGSPLLEPRPSKEELLERRNLSFQEIRGRAGFLTKFWLLLFANMLLPIVALYLLGALKIVSSPNLMGGALFLLPDAISILILPICALLGIFLTIVSFVSMPIAATSELSPKESVKMLFSIVKKKAPELLLLAGIVFIVNILVGSPLAILHWGSISAKGAAETLQLCVLQEIWQGLTSVVLVPLSLVPFCYLLKADLVESRS